MKINIRIFCRVIIDKSSYPVQSSDDTKPLKEIQRDRETDRLRQRQTETDRKRDKIETGREIKENQPTFGTWCSKKQLTRQIPIISRFFFYLIQRLQSKCKISI